MEYLERILQVTIVMKYKKTDKVDEVSNDLYVDDDPDYMEVSDLEPTVQDTTSDEEESIVADSRTVREIAEDKFGKDYDIDEVTITGDIVNAVCRKKGSSSKVTVSFKV